MNGLARLRVKEGRKMKYEIAVFSRFSGEEPKPIHTYVSILRNKIQNLQIPECTQKVYEIE